jgi:hypothetical protein
MCFSLSVHFPVIQRPTRVTHTSATLIDNIYVKSIDYENVDSRILTCDISDHFPIIACLGIRNNVKHKEPLTFSHRRFNADQLDHLSNKLKAASWEAIFREGNVNDQYNKFITHFQKLLNECVPEIKTTIPYKAIIREPWMTSALCKSLRKRNNLYRKTVGKSRDSSDYTKYVKYRNLYNSLKRCARKSYYTQLLTDYEHDIRKTWKVLNTIIGKTSDKSTISDTFIVNGNKETDKTIIANEFCNYFTNIGKQYAESIPNAKHTPAYYLGTTPNPSSMFFTPTDPFEIRQL